MAIVGYRQILKIGSAKHQSDEPSPKTKSKLKKRENI